MNYLPHQLRTALCLALLSIAALVSAQETTGSISGTILDPSGASIRGAAVTLINTDKGDTVRTVSTDKSGFFTATSLPLGTYTVTVASQGFQTEDGTGLVLHVNDALTVNRPREATYNLALVDLEEGPRMMTRIDGVETVPIGTAVKAKIIEEAGAPLVVVEVAA